MSNKKLDLRFISLFIPFSASQSKLDNCNHCDCDVSCDCDKTCDYSPENKQAMLTCDQCDCYSKSCYCDRSSSDDEENEDTGRCDSSD